MADEYTSYEVTEADFNAAVKNAGYWANRRLFKKMTKVSFTRQGDSRPPKDVEEYVKRFVFFYKDRGANV